jgi:pyridoxine 4-dehydrogenase
VTSATVSAAAAGTWKLGDLTVNRIGFGTRRLTADADGSPIDRDRAITVLRRAVELGVNHIDTAAFYFSPLRSANELISRALAPYPDDLVITTKVGPTRDPSGEMFAATPQQLRGHVEENLRQLGRDHLDVVNLRRMGNAPSFAEDFAVLADLRAAGLIRHLGISAARPQHLAEARAIAPVVCVQNRYSIDSRRGYEDDFLAGLRGPGHRVRAVLRHRRRRREDGAAGAEPEAVLAVARAHGPSAAQVRLAWTLQQGRNVLAIPGTGNPDHLTANVAAGALRLSPDELTRLDALRPDEPVRPL